MATTAPIERNVLSEAEQLELFKDIRKKSSIDVVMNEDAEKVPLQIGPIIPPGQKKECDSRDNALEEANNGKYLGAQWVETTKFELHANKRTVFTPGANGSVLTQVGDQSPVRTGFMYNCDEIEQVCIETSHPTEVSVIWDEGFAQSESKLEYSNNFTKHWLIDPIYLCGNPFSVPIQIVFVSQKDCVVTVKERRVVYCNTVRSEMMNSSRYSLVFKGSFRTYSCGKITNIFVPKKLTL